MDAPQKVMAAFQLGGHAKGFGPHAQGADVGENAADHAILARGVHALKHHQQAPGFGCVQGALQFVELFAHVCQVLFQFFARGLPFGGGLGVKV